MPPIGYEEYGKGPQLTSRIYIEETSVQWDMEGIMFDVMEAGRPRLGLFRRQNYKSPTVYYGHPSVEPNQLISAWLEKPGAGMPVQLFTQIVKEAGGQYQAVDEPELRAETNRYEALKPIRYAVLLTEITPTERLKLATDIAETINLIKAELVKVGIAKESTR